MAGGRQAMARPGAAQDANELEALMAPVIVRYTLRRTLNPGRQWTVSHEGFARQCADGFGVNGSE
jgi:hypothetical protein